MKNAKLIRVEKDAQENIKLKTIAYGDKNNLNERAKELNKRQDFYGSISFIIEAVNKSASLMGRVKSEAKTAAARENGKKGGRPIFKYKNISDGWGDDVVCTFSDYKKTATAFRKEGCRPGNLTRDNDGVYEDGKKIGERVY